jgi:hypothetical protein
MHERRRCASANHRRRRAGEPLLELIGEGRRSGGSSPETVPLWPGSWPIKPPWLGGKDASSRREGYLYRMGPELRSWTATHFNRLLADYHASVKRETPIPAGAPKHPTDERRQTASATALAGSFAHACHARVGNAQLCAATPSEYERLRPRRSAGTRAACHREPVTQSRGARPGCSARAPAAWPMGVGGGGCLSSAPGLGPAVSLAACTRASQMILPAAMSGHGCAVRFVRRSAPGT